MEISEIITKSVISTDEFPQITKDATLSEAIDKLIGFKLKRQDQFIRFPCLLVFNDKKELSGYITIENILRALEPRLFQDEDGKQFEGKKMDLPNLAYLWEESFFKHCHEKGNIPATEVISPIDETVKSSDPILKALYIMLQTGDRFVPVFDAEKPEKAIGILRIEEVFETICSICEL